MNYNEFMKNVEEFVFAESQPEKADIIFVPEMVSRIWQKKQLLYIEKDMPPIFCQAEDTVLHLANLQVCSQKEIYGGDYETEWEFLKCTLKNGVPEEAILMENQATFTYENAIFSRQVTDLHKIHVKKAILCCKTYHARRSLMYYQLLYPETVIMVCPACPDGITRRTGEKQKLVWRLLPAK